MRSRPMSLLASALFLVLAPGTVAVYVPWLITRWRSGPVPPNMDGLRLLGFLLALAACGVLLDAFWRFAWIGRGSPAPILPTDSLVVSGFYRFVRNPMYVAVVSIILGQAMWLWRWELVTYAAVVLTCFHVFVLVYEEPKLRTTFGQSYHRYCRHVRRWIPRLRPWDPEASRYKSFLAP
jgi:protein-S-isoprenylcysteine O-methyltransferase Ste14